MSPGPLGNSFSFFLSSSGRKGRAAAEAAARGLEKIKHTLV